MAAFRFRACGYIHRHSGSPNRHSGESRNLPAAMHSGFRRSDASIPKPPERKHYLASGQRFRLGDLNFRHSAAARNPNPPSAVTSASISAIARLFKPTPKIAPPQCPQPPCQPHISTVSYIQQVRKHGSRETSPARHAKVHGGTPDLPFLENHVTLGVNRAITSEIGFRNTANPSVLQSLDSRPQPPHSPGARLATQRVSPPPHAGP